MRPLQGWARPNPLQGSDGAKEHLQLGILVAPASPWDLASLRVDSVGLCLLALLEQCPEKIALDRTFANIKALGERAGVAEGVSVNGAASNVSTERALETITTTATGPEQGTSTS